MTASLKVAVLYPQLFTNQLPKKYESIKPKEIYTHTSAIKAKRARQWLSANFLHLIEDSNRSSLAVPIIKNGECGSGV